MKQCPVCKTTYNDDSLSFCLSDGNRLIDAADEEPTVVRSAARDALRVDLSAGAEPTIVPKPEPPGSGSSTKWIKIVIAVFLLVRAAVAALGLAGVVVYYSMGGATPTPTPVPPTPRPTATATSTPDLEKERLRDEIANIQKRLEEQKKNANTWDRDETDDERGSPITATVDSPNDGFLALRNQPDADHGERIAKIPHGAEVEILNCEKAAVTIGGRNGRWCQVDYNGRTGWVFDAWLEY
jgi:hypothetical protein